MWPWSPMLLVAIDKKLSEQSSLIASNFGWIHCGGKIPKLTFLQKERNVFETLYIQKVRNFVFCENQKFRNFVAEAINLFACRIRDLWRREYYTQFFGKLGMMWFVHRFSFYRNLYESWTILLLCYFKYLMIFV